MFAIDRKDRHMIVGNELLYETTCHNKCLLVSKGDGLVSLDCRDCRTQACESHHGSDHNADRFCLNHLTQGIGSSPHLNRQIRQSVRDFLIERLVGNHHYLRLEFACLLNEKVGTAMSRDCIYFKKIRMLGYDLKSLLANASRTT